MVRGQVKTRSGPGLYARVSYTGRERVVEGVRLARLLPEADVIFTGGRIGGDRAIAHVAAAAGTAPESATTAVVLVTSASHMPRAVAEFRAAGIEVIAAPVAYYAAARSDTPWSLIPSAASLEKFERAVYEYLGLLAMRISGW